jgi:adenosylcobinamide-GDP ribazoletransferase
MCGRGALVNLRCRIADQVTNRFLGALQFLTVLPIRKQTAPLGETAIFFPIVGALLGASAAGIVYLFSMHFDRSIAALLAITWLMAITGCLHEDGLADVADAFRAGRSREKTMLILKDSRIGTYGGIALVVSTLLRWQALAQSGINPIRGLPAALALSRTALVVMAHIAPPTGEGLGQVFARGCSRTVMLAAVTQAVALAFCAGWRLAVAMTVASAVTILLARVYFLRRLGGVNGDCLGATCQAVETVNLVVLAWRFFI